MSAIDDSTAAYEARVEALRFALGRIESLAVAYSGGVDSSVLLHAAHGRLGDRAVGVIADSASLPRRELEQAREVAARIGAHLVVLATAEMDDPRYRANAGDRCYFCKSALFDALEPWARANGFEHVAFGEIADDALDVRPGGRAAHERGVRAPLVEAGFTKDDVRRYAREHGLPVADKPASACLASRLPVGTAVTPERLARIEAAEDALRDLGYRVLRVRDHGELARVEIGTAEIEAARASPGRIEAAVRAAGFALLELAVYVPPAERGNSGNVVRA
ncbi:MAG: ATP-dependent sacrificial sulfur transferase LarE [Planctomycetota bacterium]|nr:ATP-dependent sacrificial sulfur transferase LarE [Planctomycetota bacterium]